MEGKTDDQRGQLLSLPSIAALGESLSPHVTLCQICVGFLHAHALVVIVSGYMTVTSDTTDLCYLCLYDWLFSIVLASDSVVTERWNKYCEGFLETK